MKKKNRASVSSKPIKMTDAELSKKLGHYQAMSVIWFWVGVVGAVSGAIFYFVLQNKALKSLLVAVLFFWRHFLRILFQRWGTEKTESPDAGADGRLFPRRVGKGFRAGYPHPGNVH